RSHPRSRTRPTMVRITTNLVRRRHPAARRKRRLRPGRRVVCHRSCGHRPGHWVQRDLGGAGRLGVYSEAFTGAVRAAGAFFSVTVQMNSHVKAAIAGIGEDTWVPINTPRAIWDDQLACWVSDAQVAEVPCTAFTSKKNKSITARLIVRRVKDLNRKAGEGQDELFTVWRYHAVFTDSPFTLLQAEEAAPRPRRCRAGLRRPGRRAPGAPAVGLVPRQRRLACLRRHQPQPAERRRVPSQPRLRQSQRSHAAPRPHRRRRPARPPRPRRDYLHLPGEWHREQQWLDLLEAATGPPARAA